MNFIPTQKWIMDKWFFDPNVHGILQNVIHMLTWHPRPLLAKRPKHHGRKIHATTSQIINNRYLILFTIFWWS